MPIWTSDETLSIWKEIERDGVPDNDRLVLTANVYEYEDPDYGIGIYQDGNWWHTIDEATAEPPTHWADFERLPVSALKRSPDTALSIAGLAFTPEEISPKPMPYMEDSRDAARNLVSAINRQSELFGCLAGEIQADGGVVTFKVWGKNSPAIEVSPNGL